MQQSESYLVFWMTQSDMTHNDVCLFSSTQKQNNCDNSKKKKFENSDFFFKVLLPTSQLSRTYINKIVTFCCEFVFKNYCAVFFFFIVDDSNRSGRI